MTEKFSKLDRHETDIVLTTDVLGNGVTMVIDADTGYCAHSTPNYSNSDEEAKAVHEAMLEHVKNGTLMTDEPNDDDDGA